jgi:hypothetical protein
VSDERRLRGLGREADPRDGRTVRVEEKSVLGGAGRKGEADYDIPARIDAQAAPAIEERVFSAMPPALDIIEFRIEPVNEVIFTKRTGLAAEDIDVPPASIARSLAPGSPEAEATKNPSASYLKISSFPLTYRASSADTTRSLPA